MTTHMARDPFPGSSEMAERMRALDWGRTAAGPVESWPQSLRATVRTLLGSRYPMVLLWGEDDLIQIYNDAYTSLIGAKHPDALGRSIKVTQAESWDTIGPMIRQVMTTTVPNWVPAQLLAVNRAGYDEEAYFSLSYSAVEDDGGVVRGMLCVCSEVTQQVLGERRLKLQRDLAAETGETRSAEMTCRHIAAVFGGYRWDVPFARLYLRDDKAPGLKLAASVGGELSAELAPETLELRPDSAADAGPLERAARGETVIIGDLQRHGARLRGGPWEAPVETALALPIAGVTGSAALGVMLLGVNPSRALDESYRSFYDLLAGQVAAAIRNARAYEAERQRAEALAELDRAKTRFFSNVSHEFRTPLTLMIGPIEDALARPDLATAVRADLDIARRNALRLLKLVNTLLDFSRVEAGRIEAQYEPVDLGAVTAELASSFRSAIEKAGLRLEVRTDEIGDPTYVDRDMWEKIVLNLVSNAFKHTFEGTIRVAIEGGEDGGARLVVSDTGVGIDPEQIGRVFERFHRVEGAQSRTHEGSGIGLALVRELVALHGGSVTVESEVGRGSRFIVTIPTGSAHLPADRVRQAGSVATGNTGALPFVDEALRWIAEADPASGANGSGTHDARPADERARPSAQTGPAKVRARIVLADDNADMRAYVERLLLPSHEVTAVGDGAAALIAVREGADLLLTDIMMPVMDGFALLRAVRADPALRTLPVIMLSARAGEDASLEGLEAGADDYLVKPFASRELQARVRTYLELARLRREAEEQMHQSLKMEAIGQLTGGIAHDFNNLLGAILGSLELAQRRSGSEERVTRLLGNAMQAAQRGARLTSQLLAFSRRQRLETRATDLNAVLAGMDDLLRRTLGGKVEVILDLAPDLWPARADANQVELAVLNLAINARDAMPGGGELAIATRNVAKAEALPPDLASGEYVLIEVRDSGTGMSAEVLARIFEPFFTTKGIGKGTGLGLSQVYGTLKQLGGEVSAESIPGEGATFRLWLPRALDAVEVPLEHAPELTRTDGRGTVLLVDDDPQVRAAAAAMLAELGHEVVTAEGGREALRWLEGGHQLDVLLADHAMPGMTGSELAARAGALRPGLKVLLATGFAELENLPIEARSVLRKPFTLSQLEAALAQAYSGR